MHQVTGTLPPPRSDLHAEIEYGIGNVAKDTCFQGVVVVVVSNDRDIHYFPDFQNLSRSPCLIS